MNREECQFSTASLEYLGLDHVIDAHGIHKSADKTAVIRDAPTATDVSSLRSFMANYYRTFVPDSASTLHPLTLCSGWQFEKASASVSLHKCPVDDVERGTLWNRLVRVKPANWASPSAHSTLCSCHIVDIDFDRPLQHRLGFHKYSTLTDDTVPSVHASTPTRIVTSVVSRGDASMKKTKRMSDKRNAAIVKLSAPG